MAETRLAPRSALAGLLVPGRYGRAGEPGIALAELRPAGVTAIVARAGQDAALASALGLPAGPGCVRAGAITFVWSGPGQWVAFDAGATAEARSGLAALPDAFATMTDLGGARVVLRVAGPAARRALAKLLPIDLHPSAFGPRAGAATLAAHIPVLVWLPDEAAGFHIACYRSFGAALWHAVSGAAAEFGYEVAP
ncbi:MAG: sarcosine oxidase subunit gamma [Alphaproteobacteria bacterium]|nr:sarcosine oxidase subunit gamma [Alphaproteobacteria bacterium]